MSLFLGRSVASLHFAVRPAVVIKYLGLLFLPLAASACVPALVALLSGSYGVAWRYGAVIAALVAVGWPCSRLQFTSTMQTNEALATTALIFIISPLALSFPLTAYGISPLDAVFEAVSGATTTGLSTLGSVENMPAAFLFSRAWLQWIGGLGVAVLAVAMLIRPGATAKRLGFDDQEVEDVAGGTRAHAKHVLIVYSILTVAGVLGVWALGAPLVDAVVHVLAAVSTGGFSSFDRSLAGLASPWVRGAVTLLCFIGAVSFSWYYLGLYRRPLKLIQDVQVRTLLAASLLTIVMLQVTLVGHASGPWGSLGHAVLMGLSAQTTAGFSSIPVAQAPDSSKLVLILAMAVGGGLGSTAGGFKILRLLIFVRLLGSLLQQASIPGKAHVPLTLGGARLRPHEIQSTVVVVSSYVAVILLSWLIFLGYGHAPLDSLFEVTSATATAGLSAGITSEQLDPVLKGVLCLDMVMGRVEVVAVLILFFPPTWIGKRRDFQ